MNSDKHKPASLDRRQLLKWSTPVITAVALPAHAAMSPTTTPAPQECAASPVANAGGPSKCAGDPPIGQATITITSDSTPIEITAISHNAPGSDSIGLPGLPATVDGSSGVDISWSGPASDALTCLPLSQITFDVTYTCDESPLDSTSSFNLTEILASAIP